MLLLVTVMPVSPRNIPRPSSLPVQVVEVVPPPAVPPDLSTPSPVRPRHLGLPSRAGSLSPAIHSHTALRDRKENEKNSKFVKLLDHNIHNSNILYKQSGK